jgi:ferric-dicitrate binding protein FerR (iron transport regulator)
MHTTQMISQEFEAIEAIVRLGDNEAELAQSACRRAHAARTLDEAGEYWLTAQMHADHAKAYYAQADDAWTSQIRAAIPPKQIPDTYWSRRRIQLTLALICFVAAAGVLGWWLAQ